MSPACGNGKNAPPSEQAFLVADEAALRHELANRGHLLVGERAVVGFVAWQCLPREVRQRDVDDLRF